MAIKFKDFLPRRLKAPGFITEAEYETFDAAATAASEWITKHTVHVVTMETVVLPNVWSVYEKGTRDPSLEHPHDGSTWHQFVRVWYEE